MVARGIQRNPFPHRGRALRGSLQLATAEEGVQRPDRDSQVRSRAHRDLSPAAEEISPEDARGLTEYYKEPQVATLDLSIWVDPLSPQSASWDPAGSLDRDI